MSELPCLDQLEATPTILRGLMAELDHEDVRWKPAPDRFSVGEVLAHLSHSEGYCYRTRLDRFLARPTPASSPTMRGPPRTLRAGRSRRLLNHFEEQRETNLEFLRTLTAADGARTAMHRTVGPITLAQMLHEWTLHDLGHIRQVAELVRARKYLAGAGPLGSFYNLKP